MTKDVYEDVNVNERVVADDDVVEDVEDEVVLVDAGNANVGDDVRDVDVEVEVDVVDLNLLKVVDADAVSDGKVPFKT